MEKLKNIGWISKVRGVENKLKIQRMEKMAGAEVRFEIRRDGEGNIKMWNQA